MVLRRTRGDVIDAVPMRNTTAKVRLPSTGNRLVALRALTDPVRGDPPVAHSPVRLIARTGRTHHSDLRALALYGHVRAGRESRSRT